jgi:hypothetical protein
MTSDGTSGATSFLAAVRRVAPLAALCVAACSSPKATKRDDFGPTYKERMSVMDKVIKNKDYSVRSSFEKEMPKSTSGKTYRVSAFKAKEAAGIKPFAEAGSTYPVKGFGEAGKKNSNAAKSAREADEKSQLASRMFHVPDASFEPKATSDAKKAYPQGDSTFATRDNPVVTKELKKNKKPVMINDDKYYTEEDVKRLLNKG